MPGTSTRRIAELDADHVEIVRLSTPYGLTPLQLHWFSSVGTPAAGIAPAVIDAVYRHGTGTSVNEPAKRRDDSVDHMVVWWEHGASAAATVRSIGTVNRYHAHVAREHPSSFADPVHILCLNATLVETATRSLGLRGFDATQERAVHRLWAGVAEQFTMPDGRPVTALESFPASVDAVAAYVAEHQARPWPVHGPGHASTTAGIEHFATTWFPRPLHPFGRALVTAFLSPHVLRAHAVPAPSRVLRMLARGVLRTLVLLQDRVLPDPRETLPDRRRREGARSAVDTAVHRGLAPGGCPHLSALG